VYLVFFFSSRRRHTRSKRDWSSDVCSSDLFLMNVVANLIHFNEADEIDVRISSYGGAERYKDFRDSEKVTSFVGGDIRKFLTERSEERRVGKECRWVWAKEHEIEEERKKKE